MPWGRREGRGVPERLELRKAPQGRTELYRGEGKCKVGALPRSLGKAISVFTRFSKDLGFYSE